MASTRLLISRLPAWSAALPVLLLASGCNNFGGGSGESIPFKLVASSITTNNQVKQNQDLTFTFNVKVDPASVTSETLQVLEVDPSGGGGSEPLGARIVTGNVVRFRPSVSIDSNGNVAYGFLPGKTYQVTIPSSPNTAVRSMGGAVNAQSFSTTFLVSNAVVDAVPGNPQIKNKQLQVPADLINAPHDTDIVLTYLDIMNVSTLINTTTGSSQSMSVRVDLDGNPATSADQLAIPGSWSVSLDTEAQETVCTYRLAPGTQLPGPGPTGSRRVLVLLNATLIKDLGGNNLATGTDPSDGKENPTVFIFKTLEEPCPPPVDMLVDFSNNVFEDAANSGLGMWNSNQPGLLVAGNGGGRGTHGEFVGSISTDFNTVGALATDGSSLPSVAVSSNVSIPGRIPFVVSDVDSLTGTSLTIQDGIFQFSSFTIPNGITVRFEGDAAARIYVRGNVQIDGTLDVGGIPGSSSATQNDQKAYAGLNTPCQGPAGSATSWDDVSGEPCPVFPQYPFGKPGGRGGAGGGNGGRGGDLPTNTPAYPASLAPLFQGFNGVSGSAPSLPSGATVPSPTGGGGTLAVPVNLFGGTKEVFGSIQDPGVGGGFTYDNCTSTNCANTDPNLAEGIVFFATGASPNSYAIHIGAPGGGGASFAASGEQGRWCNDNTIGATCANKLPPYPFASLTVPLTPPVKTDAIPYWPLPPIGTQGVSSLVAPPADFGSDGVGNFSMLRGGAGGGGGGTNAFGVAGNVSAATPVTWATNGTISGMISVGAAGGGGGGVLQLQAGRNMAVTNASGISAIGGDGGDHLDRPGCTPQPQCGFVFAGQLYGQGMCPGGAGGGGSVLLQAAGTFTMANNAVSVRGGIGGDGRLIELAFNSKFILVGGSYPGYNAAARLRLRGGDGAAGRWHYQSGTGQNIDAAFAPVQASDKSSPYTGINIPVADFSGAQSKWMQVPASGAFIDVGGYTLTTKVQSGSGTQVFVQNDLDKNEVLDNTFANGGTLPVQIFFQGTRADAFNSPDPAQRTKWTQKITDLSTSSPKFIRFIVIFSRTAALANPDFIGVDSILIRVSGC